MLHWSCGQSQPHRDRYQPSPISKHPSSSAAEHPSLHGRQPRKGRISDHSKRKILSLLDPWLSPAMGFLQESMSSCQANRREQAGNFKQGIDMSVNPFAEKGWKSPSLGGRAEAPKPKHCANSKPKCYKIKLQKIGQALQNNQEDRNEAKVCRLHSLTDCRDNQALRWDLPPRQCRHLISKL